jgi:hypothetical protein
MFAHILFSFHCCQHWHGYVQMYVVATYCDVFAFANSLPHLAALVCPVWDELLMLGVVWSRVGAVVGAVAVAMPLALCHVYEIRLIRSALAFYDVAEWVSVFLDAEARFLHNS